MQTPGKGETYRPIVLFKLPTLMCAKRVYARGHQGFVPLLGGHQRRTHTRARDSTARSRVGMNGTGDLSYDGFHTSSENLWVILGTMTFILLQHIKDVLII